MQKNKQLDEDVPSDPADQAGHECVRTNGLLSDTETAVVKSDQREGEERGYCPIGRQGEDDEGQHRGKNGEQYAPFVGMVPCSDGTLGW
jgi:hypothetical protein